MGIPAAIGVAAAGLPNAGDQANAVVSGTVSAVGPTQPFAFRGPMNLAIWASIVTTLTTVATNLTASVASATGLANGDSINSTLLPRGTTIGVLSGTNVTLAQQAHTIWGSIGSSGQVTGLFPTDRLLGASVVVPSNNEQVVLPSGTVVSSVIQAYVAATAFAPAIPGIIQLSKNPTAVPANNSVIPLQLGYTANAILTSGADAAATFTGAGIVYVGTMQLERSFDGGFTWLVCNIGNSGILAQWNAGTPVSLTFGEPEKEVLYRLNCVAYVSGAINYRISQTGGAAESLAIGPLSGG
jgi:hypothetical protein